MNPRGIDCAHARPLIDRFVVDELTPSERNLLSAHVRGCPACSAELGGASALLRLLGSLPQPEPTEDLDLRILTAALADRRRRHETPRGLAGLWTQAWRGAVRTTGTLALTIAMLVILGGAFVVGAASLVGGLPQLVGTGRGSMPPVTTPTAPPATTHPTDAVTPPAQTTPPTDVPVTPAPTRPPTATPVATPDLPVTPAPTPVVTPPSPTPAPTEPPTEPPATPVPTAAPTQPPATPTPAPTESASPTPTPTATPVASPTPKPRRTPTPPPIPSPTPAPAPTVAP